MRSCSEISAIAKRLAELPASEGPLSHVDGNSQGCRALHSVFATLNPGLHCAHLSFDPMQDPNGQIKCQQTKQVKPTDLFAKDDFMLLSDFSLRNDIDPEVGHDCMADICK